MLFPDITEAIDGEADRVHVLGPAPLGDPVEYAVMGSRVAIRRGDADLVIVREVE